jgi:acyl-CoA synthetase (NDP forming)
MIAATDLGELLDAAALLAAQPVPAGNRVGVVSNTRGGVVLAADACADASLQIASLAGDTRRALRDLLPREAVVAGPVDTTVLVVPGGFRRCLELVGADPGVDAVLTGLHGPDEVQRGFRLLQEAFGSRLGDVVVQPEVTGGVEEMISVLHEQVAGPLVLFGADGAADDALADRAARLAPLTDADADDLLRSVPVAPRLLGRGGTRPADLAALLDMLLCISRMVEDLPQIAELELSPVIARPGGVQAVDGRIRIQAAEPADAHLRRLP